MKIFKKIPLYIKYIFSFFIISRIILLLIGIWSKIIKNNYYSNNFFLEIWKVWDSSWYIGIAKYGYSVFNDGIYSSIVFFPLYPALLKFFQIIFKDYIISGILVSNIFFIISCIYLYKLLALIEDKKIALMGVKYLVLFPAGFIFSAVFTESLFLALILTVFYYSLKQRWLIVGIFGFFIALTKPQGIIVFLPVLYEYLFLKKFKIKQLKLDILYLLLIPLGFLVYLLINYLVCGNFFGFLTVQNLYWHHKLSNPFVLIFNSILHGDYYNKIYGIYTIIILSLILFNYKKIRYSFLIVSLLFLFMPLFSGLIYSMIRYSLIIFPIYIILAKLGKNKIVDWAITISFILLQGYLMFKWVNWSPLVI